MHTIARLSLLTALGGTLAAVALAPTPAKACGGTFCDAGPQPMPVDQSGENILFVRDGAMMEAHIQIQYEGDPEQFGWIIPLTAEPTEIAPGSEPLFQNMLAASVPTYGIQSQTDVCQAPSDDNGFGTAAAGDDGGDGGGDPEGGVDVLSIEKVGAFEVTVLAAEQADDVAVWLTDNGYENDDAALPILQQYLDEGHVFAAVKLSVGAGIDEIHPIMIRFESDEPCVPLRLTRIAAVDNMEIRTFFLGNGRTVPRNYRHVEVNPLKIDWPNQAQNYKEVVTLAVDETSADGRAFVTEYAGPSEIISRSGVATASWISAEFDGLEASAVIEELRDQGLWACGDDPITFEYNCGAVHPLVQPLLDEFLPIPDGVSAMEFYENLGTFQDQIDAEAWGEGAGFAAGLQQRVIEPGRHAEDLLNRFPYLTRMYTTISPGEMTEDPMFHENASLGEVAQLRSATRRTLCNSDQIWTLPDGREVYLPFGAPWPDFDVEAPMDAPMPSAEFIEEVAASGAPMRLVDNEEVINTQLRAYNDGMGWDGAPVAEGDNVASDDGGCGCQTGSTGTGWMFGLGFILLGVGRRRL